MIKNFLRENLPLLYDLINYIRRLPLRWSAWRYLARVSRASGEISILYLTEQFPRPPATRSGYAHGGAVKMTFLAETFPHSHRSANILYAVSSVGHPFSSNIAASARRKGIKFVWNQNGVAYPAWHGKGWESTNEPMKQALTQADYIIYQSDFCRQSADRFLMPAQVEWEILFNPVDTQLFKPAPSNRNEKEITLVLGGNQYEQYRFELAIQALKELARVHDGARLIVTGKLWGTERDIAGSVWRNLDRLGLQERIEFTGSYTQQEAPQILHKGDILLHTKNNDPCPTIVIEAMACGLPVVYLDSGGTPELVAEAGRSVPVRHSWERNELPEAGRISEAILEVMEEHKKYSEAARQRAVQVFSLEKYVQAHRRIFEKLLGAR